MDLTFTALAVGQGDAFLLDSAEECVLVDGGKSRRSLRKQIQKARDGNNLRKTTLVCTHNDADHANGILGLLNDAQFGCDEVWLPASWIDVVQSLAKYGEHSPEAIEEDLIRVRLQDIPGQGLDELSPTEFATRNSNISMLTLARWLSQLAQTRIAWRYDRGVWADDQRLVLSQALKSAKRIFDIAVAAYSRVEPVTIRWFAYDESRPGKTEQPLFRRNGSLEELSGSLVVPVNAYYVGSVRQNTAIDVQRYAPSDVLFLERLALSRSNKRSLVLATRHNDGDPTGVLFCADSDLSFSHAIPMAESMLITVPHHGSDANAGAYARLRRDRTIGKDLYVRSDGTSKNRPGIAYLSTSHKCCTLCRGRKKRDRQDVQATLANGAIYAKSHFCTCLLAAAGITTAEQAGILADMIHALIEEKGSVRAAIPCVQSVLHYAPTERFSWEEMDRTRRLRYDESGQLLGTQLTLFGSQIENYLKQVEANRDRQRMESKMASETLPDETTLQQDSNQLW